MSLLKFRVLLDDSEIQSYRDIEIMDSSNFEEFHLEIVKAFGFRGDQMCSFYKSDKDWEKGEEIPLMSMDIGSISMRDVLIKDKIEAKGTRFFYIYNFLTLWIFYVEILEVKEPEKGIKYPMIVSEFGPNIDEDTRDMGFAISEIDGEIVPSETKVATADDYLGDFEDEYGMEDMDPLDGDFDSLEGLDI